MAVKIRLKRLGKIRSPHYRIVVADSRTKRDGRVIEEIGLYHPTENPSFIKVDSERAQYWLSVGAQPTEQVTAILKLTGDWGQFKGDKNAKSTVQVAEPKPVFTLDEKKKPVLRPKTEKPVAKAETVEEIVADAVVAEVVAEAIAEEIVEEAIVEAVAEEIAEEVVAEVVAEEAAAEAAGEEQA